MATFPKPAIRFACYAHLLDPKWKSSDLRFEHEQVQTRQRGTSSAVFYHDAGFEQIHRRNVAARVLLDRSRHAFGFWFAEQDRKKC